MSSNSSNFSKFFFDSIFRRNARSLNILLGSCCCDDVKDRKNESHSQHLAVGDEGPVSCCDDVKDRKNESHSQPCALSLLSAARCCDDVKDRKNESHSQRLGLQESAKAAVVTMSKIGKMKAIHNPALVLPPCD